MRIFISASRFGKLFPSGAQSLVRLGVCRDIGYPTPFVASFAPSSRMASRRVPSDNMASLQLDHLYVCMNVYLLPNTQHVPHGLGRGEMCYVCEDAQANKVQYMQYR